MEVVLSGQLYSGGRKNEITGTWWQLGGLCFNGAGMKHLILEGLLAVKRFLSPDQAGLSRGPRGP